MVESADIVNAVGGATLRHFRVPLDARNRRVRLAGPVGAPAGCDRVAGEATWDASTEQVRSPRPARSVTVDRRAGGRGATVRAAAGGWVVTRPGHGDLVLSPAGVLIDLAAGTEYAVRPDGGVRVVRATAPPVRWYETVPPTGAGRAWPVLLNPLGYPLSSYVDRVTAAEVIQRPGLALAEEPDGSSRTRLADGLTLDWSAAGDVVVGWPDLPATRQGTAGKPAG